MRAILLLTVITIYLSCNCEKEQGAKLHSQKDYTLLKTKLDNKNKRVSELYQNRKNGSQQLIKYYWPNDNIQAVAYLEDGKKNGPFIMYDSLGYLYYFANYVHDKREGVAVFSEDNNSRFIAVSYKGDVITDTIK